MGDIEVHEDTYYITATRDISEGEVLYMSYSEGAPRMFSQYGFVEQAPALWWIDVPSHRGEGKIQRMNWTIGTQYEGEHKSPHGHVKWPEGDKTDFEAFHNEAVDLLDKLLDIG